MAVKYLSGNRLWGTNAERLAMTTETPATSLVSPTTYESSSGWNTSGSAVTRDATNKGATYTDVSSSEGLGRAFTALSDTAWFCRFEFNFSDLATNDMGFVTMTNDYTTTFKGSGKYTITCQAQPAAYNRFVLLKNTNGSYLESAGGTFATGTTYYCDFWRDGSTFYFKAWTTSDRSGTPAGDHSISAPSSFDGILDGVQHWNSSTGGTDVGTGWVRNVTIQNGVTSFQPSTFTYPDLSNGSIFITSDTNVHYMWNGTDTWNEVA